MPTLSRTPEWRLVAHEIVSGPAGMPGAVPASASVVSLTTVPANAPPLFEALAEQFLIVNKSELLNSNARHQTLTKAPSARRWPIRLKSIFRRPIENRSIRRSPHPQRGDGRLLPLRRARR